jgi:hypothetical protein
MEYSIGPGPATCRILSTLGPNLPERLVQQISLRMWHKIYPYLLKGVEVTRIKPGVKHRYHLHSSCRGLRVLSTSRLCDARSAGGGRRSSTVIRVRSSPGVEAAWHLDQHGWPRGRCFDIIFPERLRRYLNYEEVYLRDYTLVPEARTGIGD